MTRITYSYNRLVDTAQLWSTWMFTVADKYVDIAITIMPLSQQCFLLASK